MSWADKFGDLILRLWERGQNFLWAVASAGTAVFLILAGGWWRRLGNGPALFKAYGFLALIVGIVGIIFAIWRHLEERPKPTVFLIADEAQSFWGQSRQKDDRVTTQFCFRMQATNLTDKPIKLSTLRLIQPRIRKRGDELARHVLTQHPERNTYGYRINAAGGIG
jgi:hypothetical protein